MPISGCGWVIGGGAEAISADRGALRGMRECFVAVLL